MERKAKVVLSGVPQSRHELFQQLRRERPRPKQARMLAELEALRKRQPLPPKVHD
jgi:hypothetical protein